MVAAPPRAQQQHAARGWRSLVEALRDPARSEFAFVPHQYVHAPAELVDVSLSPGESTPINARCVAFILLYFFSSLIAACVYLAKSYALHWRVYILYTIY
jgi:hypothetical protein